MMRMALGITQKELVGTVECEEEEFYQNGMRKRICSEQTLSRMENGMQKMSQQTFLRLIKRMGGEIGSSYVSWDWEETEEMNKKRELERQLYWKHYSKGEQLLKELEQRLEERNRTDDVKKKNNQYLQSIRLYIWHEKKNIDSKYYIEQMRKLLKISIPNYEVIKKDQWPYRLEELYILNGIQRGYVECKEYGEAYRILEGIEHVMQYHYIMGTDAAWFQCLIKLEKSQILELMQNYEGAIETAENGLKYSVEMDVADFLYRFLYQLAKNKEKLIQIKKMPEEVKKECLSELREAYWIAKMMRAVDMQKLYEDHAKKYYGVSFQDER